MTFYWKPPNGSIRLWDLEKCIQERVQYLKGIERLTKITDFEQPVEFQFLTEGSALDRTGHYMLRLLSFKVPNLKEFLYKYETILFEKRLESMEPFQVRVELRTVKRHVQELMEGGFNRLPKYHSVLQTMVYVCEQIVLKATAEHAFNTSHSNTCEELQLHVPFTTCLSLVRTREVEIKEGIACVPCGKWQSLLICLFQLHLDFGLALMRASPIYHEAFDDERLLRIAECYSTYFQHGGSGYCPKSVLKAGDVDSQSSLFPPCMASLHKTLRQKHRLSHEARFHYSLFLKDIGMPVEEAIEFWMSEYTQNSHGCTTCSHSWQNNSRRYIYSIRHMYGLEGGRRESHMPSCKKVQGLCVRPLADGGCPFQHFDKDKLIATLTGAVTKDKDFVSSLLEINKTKGAQNACRNYHTLVQKLVLRKIVLMDETFKPDANFEYNPASFYLQHVT